MFNPDGTEKVPTLHEMFGEREKYIPEIGKQLQEERSMIVEVAGEKLSVDYRVLSIKEKENENKDPVVLLQGFGSGWEGISELGFSLASEGRKVILLSLPGYGNSEDPGQEYYKNVQNFDNEAEVVRQVLASMRENGEREETKVHLVGHSMGAVVSATVAEKNPEVVSSVTLLNPAAVREKENSFVLGTKFSVSGAMPKLEKTMRMAFVGEKEYLDKLQKYIPKTKSSFKNRMKQRLSEIKRLSTAQLPQTLNKIECPLVYMSGEFDFVYPAGTEDGQMQTIQDRANNLFATKILQGMHHNTTTFSNEITANNIEAHLLNIESQENLGKVKFRNLTNF